MHEGDDRAGWKPAPQGVPLLAGCDGTAATLANRRGRERLQTLHVVRLVVSLTGRKAVNGYIISNEASLTRYSHGAAL